MSVAMIESTARKSARKVSSGSSKRQRTSQINLRLLPTEREQLDRRAADLGFAGATAYIRHILDLEQSTAV